MGKRPVSWKCPVCGKSDYADTDENTAAPEHIPYRGVDVGSCDGVMVAIYAEKQG